MGTTYRPPSTGNWFAGYLKHQHYKCKGFRSSLSWCKVMWLLETCHDEICGRLCSEWPVDEWWFVPARTPKNQLFLRIVSIGWCTKSLHKKWLFHHFHPWKMLVYCTRCDSYQSCDDFWFLFDIGDNCDWNNPAKKNMTMMIADSPTATNYNSKKSRTGPTERTPEPENLIARSQLP